MVKIKKQLVDDTPFKSGKNNKKLYLTYHETANTQFGADAQLHADLQSNGNSRDAAWHHQVDDKHDIQSFTHDFQLWHGGDGSGDGNMNSIAIEICVANNIDQEKAYKNAAQLGKKIMKDEGIKKNKMVVQHNHWSGKDCPHFIRAGEWYTWKEFKKLIKNEKVKKPKKKKTKAKKTKSRWNSVSDKWTGQTLKKMDKGGAVEQLQKLVGVTADGMFGDDTEAAVKKTQKNADITVDGKAGKDTYAALHNDSKKSVIKTIQKWVGTKADGYDGPNTQKALIKKYQKELNSQFDAGLDVDGLWGPATKKATVNVTKGANGNLTKVLQSALYLAGYKKDGKPDGDFGKNTKTNVENFQKDKGLSQDRIAGKGTFSALFD